MAWGLEARVPFLDHEVVELAARIPAEPKVSRGGKYILKEAARAIVPRDVIDRPKGYFPVPALNLRGPFLEFVRDVLHSERAQQRQLYNKSYVDKLLGDPEGSLTPKGHSKLWQIALLEIMDAVPWTLSLKEGRGLDQLILTHFNLVSRKNTFFVTV